MFGPAGRTARRSLLIAVSLLIAAGCGGSVHGAFAPHCAGGRYGSEKCLETSDGYLVPRDYYSTLQREENTGGVPHVSGELPSNPNDRQPATVAPSGVVAGPEGTPTQKK